MNTPKSSRLTDAEEHAFLDAAIEERRNAETAQRNAATAERNDINNQINTLNQEIEKCRTTGDDIGAYIMLDEELNDLNSRIAEICVRQMGAAVDEYYKKSEDEFNKYKQVPDNKESLKCIKSKYQHFKRNGIKSNTKTDKIAAYLHEIFGSKIFKEEIFPRHFDEYNLCDTAVEQSAFYIKQTNAYYRYCIDKICGVYKHAQALKTGYCNKQILNAYSEPNSISVCITKNTLEANGQWLSRFIKELATLLTRLSPHIKTADTILIISSKKNKELKDVVTHCKDMNTAWGYLKRPNNKFKMVFICSNKTRIQDVLQMTIDFQNLVSGSDVKLRIIHDEAHNVKEGIPPHRDIVENIVRQPNVICYIPVTATGGTVACEDNPVWQDKNLKRRALDYTSYDKTKSTDDSYSACCDAIHITMEELKQKPGWKNYNITSMDEGTFRAVHRDNLENADVRRRLDFCKFMQNDCETEAVNNGINCLHLNEISGYTDYYQKNQFNLHIMSTPRRKGITRLLAEKAGTMEYQPIVLAIYGNEGDKYHLLFDGDEKEVSDIMGSGEFNEKLDNLLTHLKNNRVNIERPFIIIGNYTPTGESLSYVNYKYGTVRGNIRLISTNAEEDYQEACRSNYMKTMFIRNYPGFISPEKYLVGPAKYIENALWYETENDKLIDNFNTNEDSSLVLPNNAYCPPDDTDAGGEIAIPAKVTCDRTNPRIMEMFDILSSDRRTEEEKATFMNILKSCCADDDIECSIEDPEGKFNFEITLGDLRCYKKKDTPPEKGQWKFKNYSIHHDTRTPFINNKNKHTRGMCEISACMDYYIIKDDSGTTLEQNSKGVFWIGYKY